MFRSGEGGSGVHRTGAARTEAPVVYLEEQARWKARDVRYLRGSWESIKPLIPAFELRPFTTSDGEPENPYLMTVIRLPVHATERPMPVGVVSPNYSLVQHRALGEMCVSGLEGLGLSVEGLECEVGLSDLGEWMNLRLYFPDQFTIDGTDGEPLRLRLEAFNSVDGSCRLKICLGWFRLVCSNGLIIGRSLFDSSSVHNRTLDLGHIEGAIKLAVDQAASDTEVMTRWARTGISEPQLKAWVDGALADAWGKKAATRIWHICLRGVDVELEDLFDGSLPSEKPVTVIGEVPGAPALATSMYDVVQALSWVASRRNDAEQRLQWQSDIPRMIQRFQKPSRGAARARQGNGRAQALR